MNELQEMLRTDFLQEVAHYNKTTRALGESMHDDASLQFAWETIQEQKKEIVRLRAANKELKRTQHVSLSASSLGASGFTSSFVGDSPTKAINLLRSQLSTHHDNNLHILQDHIIRLEQALQQATLADGHSSRHDASSATFDSSRGEGKENWVPRTTGGPDFSRSLRHQRCNCDHCRRNATSLLSLQSEVKQLRAQVASDEDVLVRAEQDHSYLKRENAALTNTLLSAKQQQEELRQLVSDLTHEKQQLQTSLDSQRRTADRNLNMLKGQLNGVQERLKESEKQYYQLEAELTNKTSELQSMEQHCNRLESTRDTLSQTVTTLRESVARLECDLYSSESNLREKTELLQELKTRFQLLEKERVRSQSNLLSLSSQEHDAQVELMKTDLKSLQIRFEEAKKANIVLSDENNRLQLRLHDGEKELSQQKQKIEGLQQETKLHDSLQKAGFETSRFKQQELERARSESETLKCEFESAKRECKRLATINSADHSKINTLQKSLQTRLQENGVLQEQLSDICSRYMDAQAQLRTFVNSNRGKASIHTDTHTSKLRQEVGDSKTTILMWMSKFNALDEEKKRLEQNNICLSEDNFSLQRQLEEATINFKQLLREETQRSELFTKERDALAKADKIDAVLKAKQTQEAFETKLQNISEDNTSLRRQVNSLNDALMKHEEHAARCDQNQHMLNSWKQEVEVTKNRSRGLEQQLQDKARETEMLSVLVHTLESRPRLQGRIFQDLLATSERQFEQVLSKVSSALQNTATKISHVEETWKLTSERRIVKSAREHDIMGTYDISQENETRKYIVKSKVNESQELATQYHHMCLMIKGLAASVQSEKFQDLIQANQFKNPVNLTRAVFAHVSTIVHRSGMASAHELIPLKLAKSIHMSTNPKENAVRRESPSLSRFIPVVSSNNSSSHMKYDLREQVIYQRWHFLITVCAMIQRVRGRYQACMHALTKLRLSCSVQKVVSRWNVLVHRYAAKAQNQSQKSLLKKMACTWKQQHGKSCCHWKWQRMYVLIQQRQSTHVARLLLLRAITMTYKHQRLQLSHSFKLWRLFSLTTSNELKLATSKKNDTSTLTTVALGKCVALLRQFCDENTTNDSMNVVVSELGSEEIFHDTELLGKYLIASTKKIAHWKFLLNRNADELTQQNEQMKRLHSRCIELTELLEMNQRLVTEMESNAADRQSISEAVSRFAAAFRGLGSPVKVHLVKAQGFVEACQAIVDVAQTFKLTVKQADSVELKPQCSTREGQSCKKVWFQSKSETSVISTHKERQTLTDSNIELLESVVGSLRNVNASRIALQNSLRMQANTLQVVKTHLSSRTKQLVVLRAFLRWKSKTQEIRRQSGQQNVNVL